MGTIWNATGSSTMATGISGETPHDAVKTFKIVNGFLPEVVTSSKASFTVLGECDRCEKAILHDDHYGHCDDDDTYLCPSCLEEITEPVLN